jgi:histidine ammonia-lyase
MMSFINKLVFSLLFVALPFFTVAGSIPPHQTLNVVENEIVLTGFDLSIEDIVLLSQKKAKIKVDPTAIQRVISSHALLLEAAKEEKPIYGLNRGVGLNKDKEIFEGDTLNPDAKTASITFNKNNLLATSSAIEPFLPEKVVRALMVIKLNSFLQGSTGIQPQAAELLLEFLNRDILPIMPSRGSIGEADITILSHLGLALMGEGEVTYQGKRMPALEALALNGLSPLVPFAKDSLSIMSSNAYSMAIASLLLHDIEDCMNKADLVFSLSLEGLNGNIAPFMDDAQKARPYPGQREVALHVKTALKDSSLWEESEERALQDPLSFRSVSQVHGTTRDFIISAKQKLLLHLNSSDDNPITVLDSKEEVTTKQEQSYYIESQRGAVIPTANFDTINWVIDFEALAIALSHVSEISTQRMLRLSSEKFTHLTRFLSPNDSIVFGAIQKTFLAINTENHTLSMPVSFHSTPVAGEIEDHATNSVLVLQRFCKMIENTYYLLGLELMHGSQAVDLRKQTHPDFHMGCVTNALYEAYREIVPFIDRDRSLSKDIEKSKDFLCSFWSKRIVTPDCLFKENAA